MTSNKTVQITYYGTDSEDFNGDRIVMEQDGSRISINDDMNVNLMVPSGDGGKLSFDISYVQLRQLADIASMSVLTVDLLTTVYNEYPTTRDSELAVTEEEAANVIKLVVSARKKHMEVVYDRKEDS